MHRLLIFDLHQHGFARADIGDRVGEDVRPLLLGERGLLAGAARLFVDHARLLPLLDVPDDDAVADHHLQRIDGAVRGERIDIGRLDPVLRRVAKDLGDSCSQCRARHRDVDVDAEADRFRVGAILLEEERTGFGIAGLEQAGLLRRRRPARLEAHQQGHEGDQHHRDALRQKEQSDHDQSAQPRVFVAVRRVKSIHLACSRACLLAPSIRRDGPISRAE